jgi:hypothetical protein
MGLEVKHQQSPSNVVPKQLFIPLRERRKEKKE